jgi:hypothetical protein
MERKERDHPGTTLSFPLRPSPKQGEPSFLDPCEREGGGQGDGMAAGKVAAERGQKQKAPYLDPSPPPSLHQVQRRLNPLFDPPCKGREKGRRGERGEGSEEKRQRCPPSLPLPPPLPSPSPKERAEPSFGPSLQGEREGKAKEHWKEREARAPKRRDRDAPPLSPFPPPSLHQFQRRELNPLLVPPWKRGQMWRKVGRN